MTQVIMDHDVSGCFGTRLAPRKVPASHGFGIAYNPSSSNLRLQVATSQNNGECAIHYDSSFPRSKNITGNFFSLPLATTINPFPL